MPDSLPCSPISGYPNMLLPSLGCFLTGMLFVVQARNGPPTPCMGADCGPFPSTAGMRYPDSPALKSPKSVASGYLTIDKHSKSPVVVIKSLALIANDATEVTECSIKLEGRNRIRWRIRDRGSFESLDHHKTARLLLDSTAKHVITIVVGQVEYGVYIPTIESQLRDAKFCGDLLKRALTRIYSLKHEPEMDRVMPKVTWAQLVNDLSIWFKKSSYTEKDSFRMVTLEEIGSSAQIKYPKVSLRRRRDPYVFKCWHDAVNFTWESSRKAPPHGRSLLAPSSDTESLDGPYVTFTYPVSRSRQAYLTVRLDQSSTSCDDALRQGLWALYGSMGSAGYPMFTPSEVQSHIAKYISKALDAKSHKKRDNFVPQKNLVELWERTGTDEDLKDRPLVNLLKNSIRVRICEASDAMNALRWSHIDRTDYGGAYVELPQEDFGSVLSVKFTNTEDLLELGIHVRRLWDEEKKRRSSLGEDKLWSDFCRDSLAYFVDRAYKRDYGMDDISTLSLRGDFERVYKAELRQQINTAILSPAPVLTPFEHQTLEIIGFVADKEREQIGQPTSGHKKSKLTLRKTLKVECRAPREFFSWTLYKAEAYKGDVSLAPSSVLPESDRQYIVVSLDSSRLLPLPIPVQGLSSFDACSKSLGAAIGSLYELDWRRITKAEFLYDAERYLASLSTITKAKRRKATKQFLRPSATEFEKSGEPRISRHVGLGPDTDLIAWHSSQSSEGDYMAMNQLYGASSTDGFNNTPLPSLGSDPVKRTTQSLQSLQGSAEEAGRRASAPEFSTYMPPRMQMKFLSNGDYVEIEPTDGLGSLERPGPLSKRQSIPDLYDLLPPVRTRTGIPPPLPPRGKLTPKTSITKPRASTKSSASTLQRGRVHDVFETLSSGLSDLVNDKYVRNDEAQESGRVGLGEYMTMGSISPEVFDRDSIGHWSPPISGGSGPSRASVDSSATEEGSVFSRPESIASNDRRYGRTTTESGEYLSPSTRSSHEKIDEPFPDLLSPFETVTVSPRSSEDSIQTLAVRSPTGKKPKSPSSLSLRKRSTKKKSSDKQ